MTSSHKSRHRSGVYLVGLGVALGLAVLISPLASSDPDGLDRVAQDLKFHHQAEPEPIAKHLPFAQVFNEYAVQGVPEQVATPLAGLVGTLVTFGLAWGLGKLLLVNRTKATDQADSPQSPSSPES